MVLHRLDTSSELIATLDKTITCSTEEREHTRLREKDYVQKVENLKDAYVCRCGHFFLIQTIGFFIDVPQPHFTHTLDHYIRVYCLDCVGVWYVS